MADNKDWIATLKRGRRFTLGVDPSTSQTFERGVDVPVTEATMKRLKEKAVDEVDVSGETELRQKFEFRRAGEAAPVTGAVTAPRTRGRRVHAG